MSVLLVACSVVVAGAKSFAAIGQWARAAPQATLARLGARAATVFGVRIPPSTSTVRRILKDVCPGGLADLLGYDPADVDTLHAQREHARFLVGEKGAHYAFTVKKNQPSLYEQLRFLPRDQARAKFYDRSQGHGRNETRAVKVLEVTPGAWTQGFMLRVGV